MAGMSRLGFALSLFLLASSALADGRAAWVDVRDKLQDTYFDKLEPDARDRLFEQLGVHDHPEILDDLALIVSRFGTYLDGLEGEISRNQEKLSAFTGRSALTDQEVGLRNHYIREIEAAEKAWARGRHSEDTLVKALGSLKEERTVRAMIASWAKHPTWRVRRTLALTCAHWSSLLADDRIAKDVFNALKRLRLDKETGVRLGVVRALGAFRRQEAFDLLKLTIRDGDWRVRAAVVNAVKFVRTNEVVDLLIEQMQREDGRLKDDINNALIKLTGENHNFADVWARWWASVGKRLPELSGDPNRGGGAGADQSQKAKDTAAFYGIPTRSERICFVIDISGSMEKEVEQFKRVVITGRPETEQPVEGKTRMEVAKNELKRAIGNLSPGKEFNIIFFNHSVKVWRDTMVKATPAGKSDARKEIDIVVPSGATYTLGGLREAFAMAGVIGGDRMKEIGIDTIFVLSDGGPTDNKIEDAKPMDPDVVLDAVRQWNQDAGIVIHTIAVDTEDVGTYFLKQLAAQNGGVFVERRK